MKAARLTYSKRCVIIVLGATILAGVSLLQLDLITVDKGDKGSIHIDWKKNSNSNNDNNINCMYHFTAFDQAGFVLQPKKYDYNSCLYSDDFLLRQLVSLSTSSNTTAVVAIRVGDNYRTNMEKLENLALVADEFLAPRTEWRIMAERFEDFDDSSSTLKPGKMLYDPIVHAELSTDDDVEIHHNSKGFTSTLFADPFIAAHRTLEQSTTDAAVDLILLRVYEEKLNALSEGLRNLQFLGLESDNLDRACKSDLAKNHGRMMVKYSGVRDFLGALTMSHARNIKTAMHLGLPYAQVTPVHWANSYEFNSCTADTVAAIDPELGILNGMECGFLPIWGGPCLHKLHDHDLKCLSEFHLGSLTHTVLPRDGVPDEVCELAKEQTPIGKYYSGEKNSKIAQAFLDWCPQCPPFRKEGTEKLNLTYTPELIMDFKKPMGFQQLLEKHSCMEIPMQCGDDTSSNPSRPCCSGDLTIGQNVIGAKNGTAIKLQRQFEYTFLSNYLTRFNRSIRKRVARVRLPREEAMMTQEKSWKPILATGKCVSLHIRRGDNIARCVKNPGSKFCAMDLTLEDYMNKAEPMMKELGNAQHVFIMTDDPQVANATMLVPYLEKGYVFEVISGHNQYDKRTFTEWDSFLESLYGVQFCRAFVGHYVSSVASLAFHRICMRYGECPMASDHKNDPLKVAW